MRLTSAIFPVSGSLLLLASTAGSAQAASRGAAPSAATVNKKVNAALKHVGNAHLAGSSTVWVNRRIGKGTVKVSFKSQFSGDAGASRNDFAQVAFRYSSKGGGVTSSVALNYAVNGNRTSENVKGQKGWVCRDTKSFTSSIVGFVPTSAFGSDTKPSKSEHPKMWMSKPITYQGQPVYVFHETGTQKSKSGVTHISMTAYVEETSFLVPFYTASATESAKGVSVRLVASVALSDYGEGFSPKMHGC